MNSRPVVAELRATVRPFEDRDEADVVGVWSQGVAVSVGGTHAKPQRLRTSIKAFEVKEPLNK